MLPTFKNEWMNEMVVADEIYSEMTLQGISENSANPSMLPDLFILYGSQTGQAKSISEEIKLKAEVIGYSTTLMSMEEAASTV